MRNLYFPVGVLLFGIATAVTGAKFGLVPSMAASIGLLSIAALFNLATAVGYGKTI